MLVGLAGCFLPALPGPPLSYVGMILLHLTDKVQFIVMEYVDGITLTDYIEQQGVLKWRDAVHFTVQILKALQHAHDRGIVHRDIKSSNVMLLSDGTIKVMDFGIARFNRENNKTVSEKTIGSVHYISPEQARGDITDERSDIYSVGVALYEMLTGRKPFDGDTPVSIALMHMQSTPKKPTEINSTIPEGLEQIVLRAMQKDPAQRYQTAGEMIKDLEEFKANPSIIFEYKYNSTDGTTKYFDRPIPAAEQERNRRKQAVRTEPEEDYEEDDYDEDDEDAPSVPGFAVKSIAMGVLWAAIVMLVCAAANGVVSGATEGLGAIVFQLLRGFEASVAAVVVTFVLAPIYLLVLRRRDEQGADTSGLALQVVALVLAVVVFVGVALALVTPVLG